MAITLYPTVGTHRRSNVALSGGNLTYSVSSTFSDNSVSASATSSATKFQCELTVGSLGTRIAIGVYDGSFDMTNAGYPGWDSTNGAVWDCSATGIAGHINGAAGGSSPTIAVPGDVLTLVVDTTQGTGNVRLYLTHSGTTSLVGTLSYTPPSGQWWPYVGGKGASGNAASGTANFAGPFTRALDSGYSAYDAAAPATVTGSASGTIALTGSGASQVLVQGSGSGAVSFAGSSAGKVSVVAAATGSLGLSGSVSATALVSASAAGSFALTGSAVGVVPVSATAAGTLDLTGSATGALGTTVTATASGSLGLTGSANAAVAASAAATGTFGLSGSGTASVDILGAVSGSLALTGASVATTADNIATGTASGTLDFGGTADVAVLIRASANDNLALVGSAAASVAVAAGATGELPISGASRGGQHFSFPVPASRRVAGLRSERSVAGAHTSRIIAPALQERRARA